MRFNIENNWPCKNKNISGKYIFGFSYCVATNELRYGSKEYYRSWIFTWKLDKYYQNTNKNTILFYDPTNIIIKKQCKDFLMKEI